MRSKHLIWFFLLAIPYVWAASDEDLLEPDQAFALQTRAVDANTIEATWKIAPGYYLYRDKFKFESLDPAVTLKATSLPSGKRKDDPFFGSAEIYLKEVTARLPLERTGDAAGARLRITAQGCNEPIGVCYPPITKEVTVSLPAASLPNRSGRNGLQSIASLKDLAQSLDAPGTPEVVDPEQAFVLDVSPADRESLRVRFTIADCCYLYRDKLRFDLDGSAGARLGTVNLPAGEPKTDEFLGKTEVYHRNFDVRVPLHGLANGATAALKVGYQGCSEKGVAICYPPMTKQFSIAGAGERLAVATLVAGDGVAALEAPTATGPKKAAAGLVQKYGWAMLAAFGVGLLLTFTPCVLPLIPILSSVIVGSAAGRQMTKLEGGALSGAYVLGTAVTYTVAGVIAGATGEQLQAYFQNPWVLGSFAALFAVLSLSMFGFYELQMPAFIQSHLHHHSSHLHTRFRHLKGGAFAGLFAMGLLSALIVGACVSPLFISALGVAIANRDPVLGGAIMFSMALGMGVILVGIGIGAGFLLPKAGPWMDKVKQAFGVMLLGVAVYLLGFIPEVPVLFLWAALLIVVGVYLGATQGLPKDASGWAHLWKGAGTFLLAWGILALMGAMTGNRDVLRPLPAWFSGGVRAASPQSQAPLFQRVRTVGEIENRLAQAQAAGKGVVLDYYATWCTDCVRMEQSTFLDPRVREALGARFVAVQADVTDPNDADVRAMKQRFGVFGPPAMLFFGSDGAERRDLRTYGYKDAEQFLGLLGKI